VDGALGGERRGHRRHPRAGEDQRESTVAAKLALAVVEWSAPWVRGGRLSRRELRLASSSGGGVEGAEAWLGRGGVAPHRTGTTVLHGWKGVVGEAFLIAWIVATAMDGMGWWGRRRLWGKARWGRRLRAT
jgi:hypothetical protein